MSKLTTKTQKAAHALRMRDYRAEKKKARDLEREQNKPINKSASRALTAHAVISKIAENPTKSVSTVLREIGATESYATHPSLLTRSDEWQQALDKFLPRSDLLDAHRSLLRASRIDHMTFIASDGGLTDEDIHAMFNELSCKVRKIIHRDTGARDVYFWSPDNRARKDALEMAYKLRGDYAGDKAAIAFSLVALSRLRDTEHTPLPAPDSPERPHTA